MECDWVAAREGSAWVEQVVDMDEVEGGCSEMDPCVLGEHVACGAARGWVVHNWGCCEPQWSLVGDDVAEVPEPAVELVDLQVEDVLP